MATLLLTDSSDPRCVITERRRTRTRLSARVRSYRFDRALASGISPDASAALSLRARTLIDARTRARLARALRRLVKDAKRPFLPLAPGVPVCRRKILASAPTLQGLADRLVSRAPVDARGVAQIRLLLAEGAGPVFYRPGVDDLEPALQEALEALEPRI